MALDGYRNGVLHFCLTKSHKIYVLSLHIDKECKINVVDSGSRMESLKQKISRILADRFGYSEFLNAQERIILKLLSGKSLLAVMPTGSGKSLCYQLPALAVEGYALVVSPMISLMKDQVMQMQDLGIPAAMHNSLQSSEEQALVRISLAKGELKLLYLAPETLFQPYMMSMLRKNLPSLIAIDEAHCISMWGHDFRPEYRELARLRDSFSEVPVVALTATAIPKVQDDICDQLGIDRKNKIVESFDRENLLLMVEPKKNSLKRLIGFLHQRPDQSGIVYCMSRKRTEVIAKRLRKEGFDALPYHAGLTDEERHKNQEDFINDNCSIIVATVAFGMGINKPNVRYVVHLDLPKSLESYYQEIGRAGRDGLHSTCLLFYSLADLRILKRIIQTDNELLQRQNEAHLEAMIRYGKSKSCRRIPLLSWFGEKYEKGNCGMCDNCLHKMTEQTDVSTEAQKLLSAIFRAEERYPIGRIIKILRGSRAKEILEAGDDQLSVWGIGKDFSGHSWQSLYEYLKEAGAINTGFPGFRLVLGDSARDILVGKTKVFMPSSQIERSLPTSHEEEDWDEALFKKLSELRRFLAKQKNVPPYVIFSDRSLRAMAQSYPQTDKEFLNIPGVGDFKLREYGETFMQIIAVHQGEIAHEKSEA